VADLDDISRCPQQDRCESCGNTEQLEPATLDTSLGVYCATLCIPCGENGKLPRLTLPGTALRVLDHCQHLGIDLDQATELREQERNDEETDRG